MKKICLIILAVLMLSGTACGETTETLSALLKSDLKNAQKVAVSLADGKTLQVDKEKFFEISDNAILTKNENPKDVEVDGIYIHVYNKDESYTYAYITKKGEVDEYSGFMSNYPQSKFVTSEDTYSKLESLVTTGVKKEKNYKSEINFLIGAAIVAFIGLIIYNKKS